MFRENGLENKLTLVEAAKRLSLPRENTRELCICADKRGELVMVAKHQKPVTELQLELSKAKRKLAEVKMKRDFLKK